MVKKIIHEYGAQGQWREIVYSDGVIQRMQEWDKYGNLKSITTYTEGHVSSYTTYDLVNGYKTSIMHIVDGVKSTDFLKEGVPTFTLKEYPDGRISCVSHQKVKQQTKVKLLSLLQKSRS